MDDLLDLAAREREEQGLPARAIADLGERRVLGVDADVVARGFRERLPERRALLRLSVGGPRGADEHAQDDEERKPDHAARLVFDSSNAKSRAGERGLEVAPGLGGHVA